MASFLRAHLWRSVKLNHKPPHHRGIRLYSTSNVQRRTGLTILATGLTGLVMGLGASQFLSPKAAAPLQKPVYGSTKEFRQAVEDLKSAFSDRSSVVSTELDDLKIHSLSTNTYHAGSPYTVVVYPESTEDVVKIVKIANKYRMPVTAYSGATSLEGHFISVRLSPSSPQAACKMLNPEQKTGGGICVDMSGMNQILEIHEADADVVCQPGLGYVELNETLKAQGIPLFFPLDPAPQATIGGMVSTGCSGTNAVHYGTAKAEWFLNLTVVLPNGEVIKTRRRARKSSAGFDTTKLFIGAEGTLGIITEVTLRLAPVLPTTVASVQFPDTKKAVEASIEIMRSSIAPGIQCVELVDDVFMAATNKYEICIAHGGTGFRLAKDADEAADIWEDRKNAHYVGLAMVPGAKGWVTDVCVPVSRLPDLVRDTKADLAAHGIVNSIIGHVGDGNFHALLLFKDEELPEVRAAVHRMVERAIALDGTCTGEHGVGIGKREFLVQELGKGTVALMKTIKRAVDPLGLFNPGKVRIFSLHILFPFS
ncbi:FAD-binding protein [Mycena sanguinolenta]|uniref:D-lactate dehydrogenase (cytochrome) n=1 Tax=Mycena sanguinolenta TaxID=230812 RepID=A0A8H7D4L7_9AGAR|nr:FAD-binding protein [Mycena sanguinolenta]